MTNYPDDWRTWDHNDPRSPTYEGPKDWCEDCQQFIDDDGKCGCELDD